MPMGLVHIKRANVCMHAYKHVCMYVRMDVWMDVWMYVSMYAGAKVRIGAHDEARRVSV